MDLKEYAFKSRDHQYKTIIIKVINLWSLIKM